MDVNTLKSTSFWIAAAALVATFLTNILDIVPAPYTVYVAGAIAVAYAIGRTITKYRADFKRGYHTTEFYLALVAVAQAVVAGWNDSVPNAQVLAVTGALVAAQVILRALQTARLVDVPGAFPEPVPAPVDAPVV